MNVNEVVAKLEFEWSRVDGMNAEGFFAKLYFGQFDPDTFQRVLKILDMIDLKDSETVDKRLVEVVWFIPAFMRWQREGWDGKADDLAKLDEAISQVEGRLTTILGLP